MMYYGYREVTERLSLPEGNYVLIPMTFNKGEECQFLIRLYLEKYWRKGAGKGFKEVTRRYERM